MYTNKTPIKLYLRCQMYKILLHDKPPESNLDRYCQESCEKLSWEVSVQCQQSWSLEQAANWIQFLRDGGGVSSAAPA
jgi:hypothetical protein